VEILKALRLQIIPIWIFRIFHRSNLILIQMIKKLLVIPIYTVIQKDMHILDLQDIRLELLQ